MNWYTYCYNNPLIYKDANGMEPYSIRTVSSDGDYTLTVTPREADALIDIPLMGMGIFDPLVGLASAGVSGGLLRAGGARKVNYEYSDTVKDAIGYSADFADKYVENKVIKELGKWVGGIMDTYDITKYAYVWFTNNEYQIEEAIKNQFSHDVWISDTRDLVDSKFNYAMNNMTLLMLNGDIEVKKAAEYFGQDAFGGERSSILQRDPLTGRERLFFADRYYFFMNNESVTGKIRDIETNMRQCALD